MQRSEHGTSRVAALRQQVHLLIEAAGALNAVHTHRIPVHCAMSRPPHSIQPSLAKRKRTCQRARSSLRGASVQERKLAPSTLTAGSTSVGAAAMTGPPKPLW